MTTKLMPKILLIMPTVVTMTLAAGWQLATKTGTNLTPHPPSTAGSWPASSWSE